MWKPMIDPRAVRRLASGGAVTPMDATDTWNAGVGVPDPTMYRNDAKNMANVKSYIEDQGVELVSGRQRPTAADVLAKFQAGQEVVPPDDTQLQQPVVPLEPPRPSLRRPTDQRVNFNNSLGLPDTLGQFGRTDSGLAGASLGDIGGNFRQGGAVDYRKGGPVSGGPPGVDTVPARLNNGEYVLPVQTTQAMGGKPALDQAVLATTGKPPVGYADGGRVSGWNTNRAKQIEDAVNGAMGQAPQAAQVAPPAAAEAPLLSAEEQAWLDMQRAKEADQAAAQKPAWKRMLGMAQGGQVQGYQYGGQLDPRYAIAVDPTKYKKQEPNAPDYADAVPLVGLPDPERVPLIQARQAQEAQETNIGNLVARAKTGEGMSPAAVGSSIAGAFGAAAPTVSTAPATVAPPLASALTPQEQEIMAMKPQTRDIPVSRATPEANYPKQLLDSDGNWTKEAIDYANANIRARKAAGWNGELNNSMVTPELMARANTNSIGGAPAGVDEAAYAAMSPAQKSAAKVASLEQATAAVRGLRNAQREREGLPPVGQQNQEGFANLKPSEQIAYANLLRGFSKDQRDAVQGQIDNRFKLSAEQRAQQTEATKAEDRYMEQATPYIQSAPQDLPGMGDIASSYFQQAARMGHRNPEQAYGMLSQARKVMGSSDSMEPLFILDNTPVTQAQAIKLLNGEDIFDEWLGFKGPTKEWYAAARKLAAQKVQDYALAALGDRK